MSNSTAEQMLEPDVAARSSSVSVDADGALAALAGSVTVADAERLLGAAEATASRGADASVSTAALIHLDAASVQVLLALKAKLSAGGRSLRLLDLPEPVSSLLIACGFGDLTAAA